MPALGTRRVVGLLATLVAVLATSTAFAPAASAHATLLFTTPAIGTAVPDSPARVQLVFDEPVTITPGAITVTSAAGAGIGTGDATTTQGGRTVVADVVTHLGTGGYHVTWVVTADDGDVIEGAFDFAVGSSAGLGDLGAAAATPATRGAVATTALRWLLFGGIAVGLGGFVGARIASRSDTDRRDPPPPTTLGAAVGLAGAVGLVVVLMGNGSVVDALADPDVGALWSSTPGRIVLVELVATLGAVLAGRAGRRRLGVWLLVLVVLAEGLRSHPHDRWSVAGALFVVAHLLAGAVWVGALAQVVRTALSRRHRDVPARPAMTAYARVAMWVALLVVATGVANSASLVGPDGVGAALRTSYAGWLAVKVVVVLGALLLALAARRRLRSGTMPTRLAGIEAGILVAVLGLSAAITTKAPPADADAALPFAPPAVGPAFVAGARAGWVGVGATASTGQLVVRLDAPTPELEKAGRFSLSGNVDLDGSPTKLEFRACGQECFVAPVDWTPGIHVVTLGVGLEGSLPGGATALRIAWPADSRPALLRRVVRAMRAVPDLTLHEQVTSRAGEFPQSSVVHISGPFLLDSDPYGSGRATTVDLVERNGGETTIALAYPGSGVYIELTVDRQFRIVREAEYSPHFLVARTMVYPDGDEDGG